MGYKLGIVGMGFVGEAVYEGLHEQYEILTYDIDEYKNAQRDHQNHRPVKALHEVLQSDIIFICVPTPMNQEDGRCDTSIVEKVIDELTMSMAFSSTMIGNKTFVIKSTAPVGFTQYLNDKFSMLEHSNSSIIFNPEFLTEKNFVKDFKEQNRIVLGGDLDHCLKVKDMYEKIFVDEETFDGGYDVGKTISEYVLTSSSVAEMVKYTTNTFLATKVSFFNEIAELCKELEVDYDDVIYTVLLDKRIGKSHYKVPGPDGKRGFGGTCFPKDLNALVYQIKNIGLDPIILQSVLDRNKHDRPALDVELVKKKGRAIV